MHFYLCSPIIYGLLPFEKWSGTLMCSQSHTISINLYTLVHVLYLIFWVVSTTSTLIQPSKCNRKIGKYYWSFRHPNYFSIITTTVTGSCRDLCLQPCSNNECYVWLYLSRVSINCIETFCLGKEQTQTKCDVKKVEHKCQVTSFIQHSLKVG